MPEGRSDNGSARATGAKDREAPLPLLLAVLGWTPRDAVAFVVGIVAVVAILVNSLSLQSGSHPAPLFEPAEVEKTVQAAAKPVKAARLPQVEAASAPVTPKLAAPHALRTPGEIITDVQRELARRGYFDGPVDGLHGPRTDGAIRDFERAVGLKPSTQPGEALLDAITRSPLRSGNGPGSTPQAGATRAPALPPTQPAAVAPAQVVAVQRALSEFGYGQIRTSGTLDPDTQRAIAAFERQRNLPITGRLSEEFIRQLSAVTGAHAAVMCYCSTEMKGAPADVIRTLALTITSRHTPRFLALLDYRKLIARNHSKVDIVCDVADPNSNRTPRLLLGEIARNERLGGTEGVCLSSDRCGSFNNTPISIG